MNEDNSKFLKENYPELYEKPISFECDDGWFDLINELSKELESLIIRLKITYPNENFFPYATQVKEKFGTLRFYLSSETDEMSNLIEKYEIKSEKICEICGKEGLLDTKAYWYVVRCQKHWE